MPRQGDKANIDTAISRRYEKVVESIETSCQQSGRDSSSVEIVTVSKGQPMLKIAAALRVGIKTFGENRAQEFRQKQSLLADRDDIRWHFIGNLQKNKVKHVVGACDLIHSVSSYPLARSISERSVDLGIRSDILIQVNVSGESTKSGIAPEETRTMIERASQLAGIQIRGLMTIAPHVEDPQEVRWAFSELAGLAEGIEGAGLKNVSMEHLSMGMSNDYRVAVQEGATIVRIGRAILGERTR